MKKGERTEEREDKDSEKDREQTWRREDKAKNRAAKMEEQMKGSDLPTLGTVSFMLLSPKTLFIASVANFATF